MFSMQAHSATKVRKIGSTTVRLQCMWGSRNKSNLTITVALGAYAGMTLRRNFWVSIHAASASRRTDALCDEERGAHKYPAEKIPPSDKLPKDSASASEEVQKWKRVRFTKDEDESRF